jgi:hypothetical protein
MLRSAARRRINVMRNNVITGAARLGIGCGGFASCTGRGRP